jgi:Domain of unknown function (DUF4328)
MNRLFETERRQPDVPLGATPPDWSALERRSRIAVACLMACAAIDTLSVVAGLFEIELLMRIRDDRGFTDAEVASNDRMMLILGMLYLAVYLLTVVFFCRWMLQAYRTVLATQPGRVSSTAREAVASFFIPFVNLIRPYRAMRELVDASTGPDGPPGVFVRGGRPIWPWGCWGTSPLDCRGAPTTRSN